MPSSASSNGEPRRFLPGGRPPLAPGDVVGEFLLLLKLGQGGMGEVWEAEQILLRRRVALKLILAGRVDERNLALFAREARAGGRLNHPGIVGVHGFGHSDGMHWIAMELVEGGWTLRDFVTEARELQPVPVGYYRRVASFVAELADALQAAHDAGVVHRDLKPQNVLITPDDRPKLTDFGLARLLDESALSASGELAGTCLYMSPEQAVGRSDRVDRRSDVFSLGIVLYEMLALQRPFEGDTTHQVVAKILELEPPDLRRLRSRIPRELAVICHKALEKRRSHRYQSAAELAAELRRFLANEPILARPPGPLRRAWKWMRRNPTLAASGSIAAAAFAAISALAVVAHDNARRADASATEARLTAERERERADEVLRLSAIQELEDLVAEADTLFPPRPALVDAYYAWIRSAERLVAELPAHRATRDQLRATALPQTAEEVAADAWRFPPGHETERWWNTQLTKLIQGLEALEHVETGLLGEGISEPHGWSIPRRLAAAEELEHLFAGGVDFAVRWEESSEALAATYGRRIPMQVGLVPLGTDPESGLQEFWHVLSGEEPWRDDEGRLDMREDSGLVLVLVPGGTFAMGSQAEDLEAPNYDPDGGREEGPVHEVELAPFFLSKFELTQGQWKRLAGWNRSRYGVDGTWKTLWDREERPASLLLPVTDVSHVDATRVLRHAGLALPTEAQWEYAARAGTDTVWWCGSQREALAGVANLVDEYARLHDAAGWIGHERWLDDGHTTLAPIGSFAPNDFGLHEIHGNVWEFCRDAYDPAYYGRSPRAEPLCELPDPDAILSRGGGFGDAASISRVAARKGFAPTYAGSRLGLRPMRPLDD